MFNPLIVATRPAAMGVPLAISAALAVGVAVPDSQMTTAIHSSAAWRYCLEPRAGAVCHPIGSTSPRRHIRRVQHFRLAFAL
jgi:hypothetical protein